MYIHIVNMAKLYIINKYNKWKKVGKARSFHLWCQQHWTIAKKDLLII